jgi:ABC-type antimicrobial peptide transport system permease subunit
VRSESLASRTFAKQLLVGFSGVGALLTAVGIYGVLALSVAARRREIAIRAAIGAQTHQLRRLVIGEAMQLLAGGVAVGVVIALIGSRALQSFLFGVGSSDPVTIGAAGVVVATIAVVACWGPTTRAAAVEPLEALRSE